MFAQVIQGRTSDADGLRAALDRWLRTEPPRELQVAMEGTGELSAGETTSPDLRRPLFHSAS